MKRFQMQYSDNRTFSEWLSAIEAFVDEHGLKGNVLLFEIFSDSHAIELVEPVISLIENRFPTAPYAGCSTNGSIVEGKSAEEHVVVAANVFECPETKAEAIQLPISYDLQQESGQTVVEAVKARPWVKAIEVLATIGNTDMPSLCKQISAVDDSIQVFGGGALAADVHDGNSAKTFVFSSAAKPAHNSAVFVLMGGEQLHVRSSFVTGWRNLGVPFEATDSTRNVLKTLDDKPAFDVYNHYIGVAKDEHFFDISVVFPLCFETGGVPLLRVATNFGEDDSLIFAADISKLTSANIAYGDSARTIESVNDAIREYEDFAADAINLYSCAGRQGYWGDEVDKETLPFQSLAPTLGFYTAGELLRTNGQLLLHNLTIVVCQGDVSL